MFIIEFYGIILPAR